MIPWAEEQSRVVVSAGRAQASLPPCILDMVELFSSFVAQFAFTYKQSELYLGITSVAPHWFIKYLRKKDVKMVINKEPKILEDKVKTTAFMRP